MTITTNLHAQIYLQQETIFRFTFSSCIPKKMHALTLIVHQGMDIVASGDLNVSKRTSARAGFVSIRVLLASKDWCCASMKIHSQLVSERMPLNTGNSISFTTSVKQQTANLRNEMLVVNSVHHCLKCIRYKHSLRTKKVHFTCRCGGTLIRTSHTIWVQYLYVHAVETRTYEHVTFGSHLRSSLWPFPCLEKAHLNSSVKTMSPSELSSVGMMLHFVISTNKEVKV